MGKLQRTSLILPYYKGVKKLNYTKRYNTYLQKENKNAEFSSRQNYMLNVYV